ncbi:hypothetical protein MtrunA17_Chr1g0164151 [Medicago truncatula]|uniref:Uncharacterized protein n=1 Tax=Medicago truncatula TaxID=3880 RepID=A0A396JM92_MEDTR|nr:hypothetical protein MtrunA17_Chr1g0164151 [Medicago truncatula]
MRRRLTELYGMLLMKRCLFAWKPPTGWVRTNTDGSCNHGMFDGCGIV